jgi:hypothetical protein
MNQYAYMQRALGNHPSEGEEAPTAVLWGVHWAVVDTLLAVNAMED